ncbi:MAG TPA: alanine--tRNA ligase, partial [Planctomycetota bacterium]|nr:alanine--tRNA ligase [Planctomycetota bacterium]
GDASVLFTPAGMNQFKENFLGRRKLDHPHQRATTCQKCFRTGDIENVGKTPRHGTFFEMLGNFSFGDYFKKEAIHWAWEFLLKDLQLDPARLQVSVHTQDTEAYRVWHNEIGLAPDRIHKLGDADNFWPADAPTQGPNGPCGPCSEIFYQIDVNNPNFDDHIEIWNLVFTQYERQGPIPGQGILNPLPAANIDTGMGLERTIAALQGVKTIFDTDLILQIVTAVAERTGVKYGFGKNDTDTAVRRISDHVRGLTFAIVDGAIPARDGRGYVLRRILRQAARDGRKLGVNEPFLHSLVPLVVELYKDPYADLVTRHKVAQDTILAEETSYLHTMQQGKVHLEKAIARVQADHRKQLSGAEAFNLYETYGLDIETVATAMADAGLVTDMSGFEAARDKAAAENVERPKDIFGSGPIPDLKRTLADKKPLGGDFRGYTEHTLTGCEVLLIASQPKTAKADAKSDAKADAKKSPAPAPEPARALTSAKKDDVVLLVLSATPFYPEMGGQVGDTGLISWSGGKAKVLDTTKDDPLILHKAIILEGELKIGQKVDAAIDATRRAQIEIHHTSTHLLQHALRKTLGTAVEQKGSAVYPDRLRFDFSCPRAITSDELAQIENQIGDLVRADYPVSAQEMAIADARAAGAMALFGEKYGDRVRVISAGPSRELCGGCHVPSTGRIGGIKIVFEEAAGQGLRRIEAVAGASETALFREYESVVKVLMDRFRCRPAELPQRVEGMDAEKLALFKEVERLKAAVALGQAKDLLAQAVEIGGAKLLVAQPAPGTVTSGDDLKTLAEAIHRVDGNVAVVLGSSADGKVALVAAMPKTLVARGAHAGNLIKELAKMVGGGGGGKPDFAQAGGRDATKLQDALNSARTLFESQLAKSPAK